MSIKNKKIINIIFYSLLTIVFVVFLSVRFVLIDIIPQKYELMLIGCFLFVLLGGITFHFFDYPLIRKIFIILRNFLIIVYTILIAFLLWSNSHLDKITAIEIPDSQIHILVLRDSKIESVKDLDGKKLKYQLSSNTYSMNVVVEKLKNNRKIDIKKSDSYYSLINELYDKKIDAILVDGSSMTMIENNFKDFDKHVKILKSYKKEVKKQEVKKKTVFNNNEPFVVLVSGIDRVGDPMVEALSDVNLLLFVYPETKKVSMVSIPRDTYVPNPATNNVLDKFTHTGVYGIDNTVLATENLFDIKIDYYIRVSFDSVSSVVDTIGGISVDVELDFCEQNSARSFAEGDLICLNKGLQALNGEQALAYARHRKTEGYADQGRNRAQQKIIKAVSKKLLDVTSLSKIPETISTLSDYIVTNMPKVDILRFAKSQLEDEDNVSWTFETLTTLDGYSDMLPTASMGWDLPLYVWIPNYTNLKIVHDTYYANCSRYSDTNKCANINAEYKAMQNLIYTN